MDTTIDTIATVAHPAVVERPESLTEVAQRSVPWTVLCVDDEPNILSAMRRLFRGQVFSARGVRVLTAGSGRAALELLEAEAVQLVISDMRMPEMDGAQLLAEVHRRWPGTARMLLTGYADIGTTIAAINQGAVYRYITKPWNDDEVLIAVAQIFEQQTLLEDKRRLEALTQRQNDELRELNATLEDKVATRTADLADANDKLKKTYLTSIKVFSNLIELRGGALVGHSRRVADMARRLGRHLGMDELECADLFVAALLHDIGQIGLPDALLAKPVPRMTAEESARYRQHPELGEQALLALDDLQAIMPWIRGHHERHDGRGFPDGLAGESIALGARILALADTWDDLQSGHLSVEPLSPAEARTLIVRGRGTQFHPAVVDAFEQLLDAQAPKKPVPPRSVAVADLQPGMVMAKDLVSPQGVLLLSADHVLTDDLICRIQQLERRLGLNVVLPIKSGG